jgi:hypothetical protein
VGILHYEVLREETVGLLRRPSGERAFAEGDAAGGGGVESPVVLDGQACGNEEGVDLFAGLLFGCGRHGSARVTEFAEVKR